MKAVQINKYGSSEVLEINDISVPIPSENQSLVKVKAVSVNPFDIKLVSGMMQQMIPLTFPFNVGGDFSGVIEKTGEEVFGTATSLGAGSGSFAEYLVVNKDKFSLKPTNLSFEEASALPLAGVSAYQAIIDEINLKSGQKILIHGGAGGIGHMAIQIAKSLGAFVATTVSTKDIDFVKGLGTDLAIDYKTQKFEEISKDYDAIFDTVAGETLVKSLGLAKVIVSMIGQGEGVITQRTDINSDRLQKLAKLVEDGKLKPKINVFEFEKIKEAWGVMGNHLQGKIVVRLQNL